MMDPEKMTMKEKINAEDCVQDQKFVENSDVLVNILFIFEN